jgi:hypothetical protein
MSVTPLRVVHQRPHRDLAAAERAAAAFLAALGVDLNSDSLTDTPARMARAYADLLTPREFKLTTFANDEGYDELVLARTIPIRSVCEHHLLPFIGVAHVGYLPGERILGLSKLARGGAVRQRRPSAGAADQAGRRLADPPPATQGSGCGHRGRTPMHDPAWGAGRRLQHRHVDPAGHPAR